MKPEAKKIAKPLEKDYFEYRGNQIIVDYGSATNFIDALNDYIDQVTSEIYELKRKYEICKAKNKMYDDKVIGAITDNEILQELQALKGAVIKMRNAPHNYKYDRAMDEVYKLAGI